MFSRQKHNNTNQKHLWTLDVCCDSRTWTESKINKADNRKEIKFKELENNEMIIQKF